MELKREGRRESSAVWCFGGRNDKRKKGGMQPPVREWAGKARSGQGQGETARRLGTWLGAWETWETGTGRVADWSSKEIGRFSPVR